MKHMNPKIVKLLHEGFSINTLEKLTSKQIDVLYSKINEAPGSVEISADKADTTKIKALTDQGINVKIGEGEQEEVTEKSVSKKQHGLMGAAYSVEKGDKELKDIPKSYRGKVKKVVDSMSKKQVKDFAKTKTSKLPEKVESKDSDEIKKLEESILRLIEDHIYPQTTKSDILRMINKRK